MKLSSDFIEIFSEILLLITFVLILLKLIGIAEMSWMQVLCPLWISTIILIISSLLISIFSSFKGMRR